jgi:hypothetical protein
LAKTTVKNFRVFNPRVPGKFADSTTSGTAELEVSFCEHESDELFVAMSTHWTTVFR